MKSAMWRSPAVDASTIYSPAGAAFCSARALRVFQGTDLTGFAGHNLVASGRLPCGSLLTTVQRQSSIRHRHVAARPSAGSAPWCRGKPQHMASRSHGQRPSLPGVFKVALLRQATRSVAWQQIGVTMVAVNSGAAMRFAIKFTARASGLKSPSTSRPSLNSHNKCNTPYGRPYIASGVLKS